MYSITAFLPVHQNLSFVNGQGIPTHHFCAQKHVGLLNQNWNVSTTVVKLSCMKFCESSLSGF